MSATSTNLWMTPQLVVTREPELAATGKDKPRRLWINIPQTTMVSCSIMVQRNELYTVYTLNLIMISSFQEVTIPDCIFVALGSTHVVTRNPSKSWSQHPKSKTEQLGNSNNLKDPSSNTQIQITAPRRNQIHSSNKSKQMETKKSKSKCSKSSNPTPNPIPPLLCRRCCPRARDSGNPLAGCNWQMLGHNGDEFWMVQNNSHSKSQPLKYGD